MPAADNVRDTALNSSGKTRVCGPGSAEAIKLKPIQNSADPKIVINHGCNIVDGFSSKICRDLVDGCWMVCNSTTALQRWDVPRSRFIRHGMSPEEWPSTDYGHNNIVIIQSFSQRHKAYRNVDGIARAEQTVDFVWVGRDVRFESFEAYRHFLGHCSIYFNPSYASPNPRARTEAMLSGLAVVTTNSHGEDEYITTGVNGFASNDFDELIEALVYLRNNPNEAKRIGQAGRRTAREIFHIDRYIEQWNDLLEEVLALNRVSEQ